MNSLVEQRKKEIEELCGRFEVQTMDLFGSAAQGRQRPDSDLDFLVEFKPLAPGTYADAYFGLLEALQTLFSRPVDLVVTSAIKNPFFRQGVERSKKSIYAA